MDITPIDRLFVANALKERVDEAHRKAREDAADYLAAKRDEDGTTALTSRWFGPEAGEYKYGKSKAKTVVEWGEPDEGELAAWARANSGHVARYLAANAVAVAEWWLAETGEVVPWMERAEREEPPRTTPPKVYKYDADAVIARLSEGGNAFEEANRLLLDGDAE